MHTRTSQQLFYTKVHIASLSKVMYGSKNRTKRAVWLKVLLTMGLAFWGASYICFAQDKDNNYLLDTHDQFEITTMRHAEYSGTFTVPADGKLSIPGIGELEIRGKSLLDLQNLIISKLKSRLVKPEVYVTILHERPKLVYVIGTVSKPSPYNIESNWRISEAISAAGGLTLKPERIKATLFRPGQPDIKIDLSGILQEGKKEANIVLIPGDTLSLMETKTIRVYIAGMAVHPGEYDVDQGSQVMQALAKAGGYAAGCSLSKAVIYRKDKAIPANLYKSIVLGEPNTDVTLEANDVVILPPNMKKVAIMGEVRSAGWFEMPEGKILTLSDALSMAGNVTKRGITTRIIIVRTHANGSVERLTINFQDFLKHSNLNGNPQIKDGDVILVQETKRIGIENILGGLVTLPFIHR